MRDGLNPPLSGAPPSTVRLGGDGSMAAFVPARRAMTWQMVGEDGTPVVRERYWVTFAAGEMRVCTNCHGVNTTDVVLGSRRPPILRRRCAIWRAGGGRTSTTAPLRRPARRRPALRS